MNLQHKMTLEKIKKEEEEKLEECLKKIQKLIQEKSEFNKQFEKYRLEQKKMDKMLKDQQERYKLDMKNIKEAFLSIEK